MKTVFLFLVLAVTAFAQLPPATGDDFTIAVYNDIHVDNDPLSWTNAVDWMVGANGRGPAGIAAARYWNIKAIAGVGDYVTACNDKSWKLFLDGLTRINALSLPGIWPQGNHDICAPYTATFSSTLQSAKIDVTTPRGLVRLGLIGVGVGDNMDAGQPSRVWADGVMSASQPNRQWIFLRHVGTAAPYAAPGPYVFPKDGNAGWCSNDTQCAGYGAPGQTGVELRDKFYAKESQVHWGVHGHNGYVAMDSLTADDGHTVNVTGNLGASGGIPGWITLLKFRPSHNDIQVAVYLSYNGVAGSVYSGPFTWAWKPEPVPAHPNIPKRGGR
ncbi:MAG: hypothetical protein ABI806_00020 [Candidatus Solibacter sp.]